MKERTFTEVFGHIPDPSSDVPADLMRITLSTVAKLLQEDPSEAALADSIKAFAPKPRSYIDQAYSILNYGNQAAITPQIRPGWNLMGAVVSEVHQAYDRQKEQINEDFDIQKAAENIVDDQLLRLEDSKWQDFDAQLAAEKDPQLKVSLARRIKDEVIQASSTGRLEFHKNLRIVIPSWNNITLLNASAQITLRHYSADVSALGDLIPATDRVLRRDALEEDLNSLPTVDKEKFYTLRKKFGAKAANLVLLEEFMPAINDFLEKSGIFRNKIKIPPFVPVSVELYQKWVNQEDIEADLLELFAQTSHLKIDGHGMYQDEKDAYIVRSSAVQSEDGEELSGAGIYNSVPVSQEDTNKLDKFKQAVITVFESTNSPQAIAYRREHGIEGEEMGLVIQAFRPDKYSSSYENDDKNVTVNSVTPGLPQLIEVSESENRFFVNREVLDQHLAVDLPEEVHHFPPDTRRDTLKPQHIERYALWIFLAEKIWGGAIQMECVGEDIVQVRRVNQKYTGEVIEFPTEEFLARGNGIGLGDKVLDILDVDPTNRKRDGLVQYQSNRMWTLYGDSRTLPKDGGVIIQTTGGTNGHIQTLAAEKGLMCMYPQGEDEDIPDLTIGGKVRMVSNGIEARLYQVPGEEDPTLGSTYVNPQWEDENY